MEWRFGRRTSFYWEAVADRCSGQERRDSYTRGAQDTWVLR